MWCFSREENTCGGRLEDTDSEEDILDYLEEEAEEVTDSDEDILDEYWGGYSCWILRKIFLMDNEEDTLEHLKEGAEYSDKNILKWYQGGYSWALEKDPEDVREFKEDIPDSLGETVNDPHGLIGKHIWRI